MAGIYDFTVKAQDGSEVSLADYKGKTLLIVNTATGCGFTPQYEPLQKIYDEYHDQGLEILDFPCNQFKNQAPGSDEEIHTFCTGRFGSSPRSTFSVRMQNRSSPICATTPNSRASAGRWV